MGRARISAGVFFVLSAQICLTHCLYYFQQPAYNYWQQMTAGTIDPEENFSEEFSTVSMPSAKRHPKFPYYFNYESNEYNNYWSQINEGFWTQYGPQLPNFEFNPWKIYESYLEFYRCLYEITATNTPVIAPESPEISIIMSTFPDCCPEIESPNVINPVSTDDPISNPAGDFPTNLSLDSTEEITDLIDENINVQSVDLGDDIPDELLLETTSATINDFSYSTEETIPEITTERLNDNINFQSVELGDDVNDNLSSETTPEEESSTNLTAKVGTPEDTIQESQNETIVASTDDSISESAEKVYVISDSFSNSTTDEFIQSSSNPLESNISNLSIDNFTDATINDNSNGNFEITTESNNGPSESFASKLATDDIYEDVISEPPSDIEEPFRDYNSKSTSNNTSDSTSNSTSNAITSSSTDVITQSAATGFSTETMADLISELTDDFISINTDSAFKIDETDETTDNTDLHSDSITDTTEFYSNTDDNNDYVTDMPTDASFDN